MKKALLSLVFIWLSFNVLAATLFVSNTNNSGAGSLRQTIANSSNGDIIRFSTSLILNGSDSIVLSSSIAFSKSLRFVGLYTATDTLFISGGNNDRIFTITQADSITIDSLVLINGNSIVAAPFLTDGGTIYFNDSGKLTVLNSVFRNNTASQGGAICVRNFSFSIPVGATFISNSNFMGNTANKGGAITIETPVVTTSTVTILNSLLKNNSSTQHGGGLYYYGHSFATLNIDTSSFIGNNAGDNGGGIYMRTSANGIMNMRGAEIRNNTSLEKGGGIYVKSTAYATFISIYSSTIRENNSGNNGGGICNIASKRAELLIENSIIDSNISVGDGGGVYHFAEYSTSISSSQLHIKNTVISNNRTSSLISVSAGGGGIFSKAYFQDSSTVFIENSNITGNYSRGGSGLYFSNMDTVIIQNSTINANFSTDSLGQGVACSYIKFTKIESTSISYNTGLGLTCVADSLIIKKSDISHNLPLGGVSARAGTIIIDSSKINSNTSDGSIIHSNPTVNTGGGMDLKAFYIEINSTNIDSNLTATNGGGLNFDADILNINNSTIDKNEATGDGGGIWINKQSADTLRTSVAINITNSSISNNISGNNGGGIFTEISGYNFTAYCDVNVVNSIVNGNLAPNDGGGFYLASPNVPSNTITSTNLINSEVQNNFAGNNGGGFCFLSKTGTVSTNNSLINANSATNGGGIYSTSLLAGSEVSILNSTVSNNVASRYAGGIFSKAKISIDYSTISGNIGNSGGGIYGEANHTPGIININASTISDNTSVVNGGGGILSFSFGMSQQGSTVNISNTTVSNNTGYGVSCYTFSSAYPTILTIESSIIALNGGRDIQNNLTPNFVSAGYNIFSDTVMADTVSTDQIGIDSLTLNIDSLGYNGGTTKTRAPLFPSVALNYGNPLDISSAQNVSIVGVRDVGAAELCSATSSMDSVVACNSYFHWIDGNTYFESNNTAIFKTVNAAGCDSIIHLNLTLNYRQSTDTVVTCNSYYTWINGNSYLSSNNTAIDTLVNSQGCDSLIHLQLTINGSSSIDNYIICESYFTWGNGITYTNSNNNATDTLTNTTGCDSVVYLDLTMLFPGQNHPDTVITCNSYTWLNGVTYSPGFYSEIDTLSNSVGCDSVVSINLSVYESYSYIDTVVACFSYTWINGITYYSSNTSASYLFTSVNNCDSLILLNLTVKNVQTSVVRDEFKLIALANNASFQWLDCNSNTVLLNDTNAIYNVTSSGSYAVEVTQNGCVDTSTCNTYINVGIATLKQVETITIYPNPIQNQFTVKLNNWVTPELQIVLINSIGKVVKKSDFKNIHGIQEMQFSTIKLSPGVYFIQITGGDKVVTKKLVLQ